MAAQPALLYFCPDFTAHPQLFMISTPVCIVGAGPAGAAAALRLAKANQPCLLVDKAIFPRDKVCGDGFTGKSVAQLRRLDPELMQQFLQQPFVQPLSGLYLGMTNYRIRVPFEEDLQGKETLFQGFVARRIDFDNFLVEEIRTKPTVTLLEGIDIDVYEKVADGYILRSTAQGTEIHTRLLIVANGAHSNFARNIMGYKPEPRHFAASVRAYYRNIPPALDGIAHWEAYLVPELRGGYLWVFPLPNNEANVGLGMLSAYASQDKINLKQQLDEVLATHPMLKERFATAERIDAIKGYGIPLGTKRRRLHGDNFLITGDAGYLVDSVSGEGIGNALQSGIFAAEQAISSIAQNDFSAKALSAYEKRIWRVIGTELRVSTFFMRLLAYSWVTRLGEKLLANNIFLQHLINISYQEKDMYKMLRSPKFYWNLLKWRQAARQQ